MTRVVAVAIGVLLGLASVARAQFGAGTSITANPVAATATALAANGANCSAGDAPRGVDASGASENCTTYVQPGANSSLTSFTGCASISAPSTLDISSVSSMTLTTTGDLSGISFTSDRGSVSFYTNAEATWGSGGFDWGTGDSLAASRDSGGWNFFSGAVTDGTSGGFIARSNDATTGTSGQVDIETGSATGVAGTVGPVSIVTGNATNTSGVVSPITITAGDGPAAGADGSVAISIGNAGSLDVTARAAWIGNGNDAAMTLDIGLSSDTTSAFQSIGAHGGGATAVYRVTAGWSSATALASGESRGVFYGIGYGHASDHAASINNAFRCTFGALGGGLDVCYYNSTTADYFAYSESGVLRLGGTAPTVGTCGTSPSINGTSSDARGIVTTGSAGPTACTVTFSRTYDAAPVVCTAILVDATSVPFLTSTSTTAAVFGFSAATTSKVFRYSCTW